MYLTGRFRTNNTKVNWSADDQISVWGGENNAFTLSSGEGTASASFSGTLTSGTAQYAMYPYSASASTSSTTFSTAFNTTSYPNVNMTTLDATHDMATANWGTGWSVPTDAQLKTLVNEDNSNKCSVAYVTTGTAGIRVTGTTAGYASNSIFLPSAGYGNASNMTDKGTYGGYWSSVQSSNVSDLACRLYFYTGKYTGSGVSYSNKCCGYSVRPVRYSL